MPIDENIASLAPEEDGPAAPPADATAPQRGRPWVKGQSGNPNGRPRHTQPSRARKAAIVAQGMLDRKTPQLMDRVIGWGQGSDKTMLRLYLQRMVPRRDEVPVSLNLPAIETRGDLKRAMLAVATGVANGEISSAQGLRLVRLFSKMYPYL